MKFINHNFYLCLTITIFTISSLSNTDICLKLKINTKISSFRSLLEKLVDYQKILSQIENNDHINSLLQNESNTKHDLETNLSKYKNELKDEPLMGNNDINNFVKSVNMNKNDAKKILEITLDYLSSNKLVDEILTKNSQNFEKYFANKNSLSSSFLEFYPADAPPPLPYLALDIPCINSIHCTGKKLLWMKCSVLRISIRTAYEGVNMPLLIMAKVIYQVCKCVNIPAGPDKMEVKCMNTRAQPGLACVVPNQVYTGLFKTSFGLWEAYQTLSHTCFNPISPYF